MIPKTHRRVVLTRRPPAEVAETDLRVEEVPVPNARSRPAARARRLSLARSLHARAHARCGLLRRSRRHRRGDDRRHCRRGRGVEPSRLQGRRPRRGPARLAGVRHRPRPGAAQDRSIGAADLARQQPARHARHDRLLRPLRDRPAQARRDGGGIGGLGRRGPGGGPARQDRRLPGRRRASPAARRNAPTSRTRSGSMRASTTRPRRISPPRSRRPAPTASTSISTTSAGR